MFRDSKIAELFSCGSTKCSCIINFGTGPYFQSLLEKALKEALYFASSFNESYHRTIKKGQIDMVVQLCDNSISIVSTRYYKIQATSEENKSYIRLKAAITDSQSIEDMRSFSSIFFLKDIK